MIHSMPSAAPGDAEILLAVFQVVLGTRLPQDQSHKCKPTYAQALFGGSQKLCAPRCGVILATDLAISVCLASV